MPGKVTRLSAKRNGRHGGDFARLASAAALKHRVAHLPLRIGPPEWFQFTNGYQRPVFQPHTPVAPPTGADPVGREIHADASSASISKREFRKARRITRA